MNCLDLKQLIFYVDGALSEEENARVEEHIKECAKCRAKVANLMRLDGFLRETMLNAITAEERPASEVDCLSDDLLTRLVSGSLSNAELQKCEAHLLHCSECLKKVSGAVHVTTRAEHAKFESIPASAPVPEKVRGLRHFKAAQDSGERIGKIEFEIADGKRKIQSHSPNIEIISRAGDRIVFRLEHEGFVLVNELTFISDRFEVSVEIQYGVAGKTELILLDALSKRKLGSKTHTAKSKTVFGNLPLKNYIINIPAIKASLEIIFNFAST